MLCFIFWHYLPLKSKGNFHSWRYIVKTWMVWRTLKVPLKSKEVLHYSDWWVWFYVDDLVCDILQEDQILYGFIKAGGERRKVKMVSSKYIYSNKMVFHLLFLLDECNILEATINGMIPFMHGLHRGSFCPDYVLEQDLGGKPFILIGRHQNQKKILQVSFTPKTKSRRCTKSRKEGMTYDEQENQKMWIWAGYMHWKELKTIGYETGNVDTRGNYMSEWICTTATDPCMSWYLKSKKNKKNWNLFWDPYNWVLDSNRAGNKLIQEMCWEPSENSHLLRSINSEKLCKIENQSW